MSPGSIWLVGAGNMGGAMLRGWIASGIDERSVIVIGRDTPLPPDWPETLVLAMKPQQLATATARLAGRTGGPNLLVSILAGVDVATLTAAISARTVVRAMPNLPVAIGKGVTALFSSGTDRATRQTAEALMVPLGLTEWIDSEALFDAVTALSGCGPGFVFRFIDALAVAGARLGLPTDQAARLALATVEGSALMAAASNESPATLADRVASPGGSTREGLKVLDRDDALVALLTTTLAASAARNRAMAEEARG